MGGTEGARACCRCALTARTEVGTGGAGVVSSGRDEKVVLARWGHGEGRHGAMPGAWASTAATG